MRTAEALRGLLDLTGKSFKTSPSALKTENRQTNYKRADKQPPSSVPRFAGHNHTTTPTDRRTEPPSSVPSFAGHNISAVSAARAQEWCVQRDVLLSATKNAFFKVSPSVRKFSPSPSDRASPDYKQTNRGAK